jgi:TPR repeat protein
MTSAQDNKTDAGQSPTASAVIPDVSPMNTAALLARGDQLLGASDIASARLFYERAAEAGDGQAALRMGMTFDMDFLARSGLRRVQGDPDQAISWYRRASALGNSKTEALEKQIQDVAQQIQSIRAAADQAPGPRRVAGPRRHRAVDGVH